MRPTMVMTLPRRETLDERAARLGVEPRACRDCRAFEPAPDGYGFGWCNAHEQHVKLAQGPHPFFSQCQFKTLTRVSRTELDEEPDQPEPHQPELDRPELDRPELDRPELDRLEPQRMTA